MNLQDTLDFAVETAYLAGRATLGSFQTGIRPQIKEDKSPVTVADRLAEELIRSRIEAKFPQHAIVGEELGVKESAGAGLRWFIDPIDGTRSFIHGVPLFGTLIGLEVDGEVQVGVAYFPALDEMLASGKGLGCWLNGRRTRVSPVERLDQATMSFTDGRGFTKYGKEAAWRRMQQAVHFNPGWGDAYGYSLVASGRIEVMLDPAMHLWDCGPFPVILQEAGGYFGDWQGNVTIYGGEGLATSQALLPEVLRILRGD